MLLLALVAAPVVWGTSIAVRGSAEDAADGMPLDGDEAVRLGPVEWEYADDTVTLHASDGRTFTYDPDHQRRTFIHGKDGWDHVTLILRGRGVVEFQVEDWMLLWLATQGVSMSIVKSDWPGWSGNGENYCWVKPDGDLVLYQGGSLRTVEADGLLSLSYRQEKEGLMIVTRETFYGPYYTMNPKPICEAVVARLGGEVDLPEIWMADWTIELRR